MSTTNGECGHAREKEPKHKGSGDVRGAAGRRRIGAEGSTDFKRGGEKGRSAVGRKGGKSESYDEWTVDQLRGKAKEIGHTGYSNLRKQQLIDALRNS